MNELLLLVEKDLLQFRPTSIQSENSFQLLHQPYGSIQEIFQLLVMLCFVVHLVAVDHGFENQLLLKFHRTDQTQ
ncbi:MAG: hypothetical protein EBX72_01115 [Betaproteobacteria bacterium]|nr:hypothetical protein [Betaproteobacteria bacterium]